MIKASWKPVSMLFQFCHGPPKKTKRESAKGSRQAGVGVGRGEQRVFRTTEVPPSDAGGQT